MTSTYEEIRALSSMDGSEGLLAIIIRESFMPESDGVRFVTPPNSPQQLGILSHPAGKVIEPHIHIATKRVIYDTQEVLIIRCGVVCIDFYTSDGGLVCHKRLYKGDIVHLISGGHGLRMDTDSIIIEIKVGPYMGRHDKKPLYPLPL